MNADIPTITFGNCVKGFAEWYKQNFETIKPLFDSTVEELFGTIEDFAVELYLEIRIAAE